MAVTSNKNLYESVVIMSPDVSMEAQKDLFRKNKSIVAQFGGSIANVETWGKRNLANPIKKAKKGIYFHSLFEAGPGAVAELERTMRINDHVLRFMHTKLDSRKSLAKYMEEFKRCLQESANREREREAKAQLKKAAAAAAAQAE